MAIAGIEGLAQGFMQGMALKRQNDRQDVLDAQNLEKFGMDKERFATQQAASAFELQNAQTDAANAAIDRKRTLAIQANQDAFDVKMKRLLSTGDDNLATLAEVEKVHHEDGVKGAFQRDPKTGVILTDEKGFATWINADGSPPQKHTGDSARKLFFAKQYPKDAMTREINNADTIAKEGREAKIAKEKDERDHQQSVELEGIKASNVIKGLKARSALKNPKDYLSKFSMEYFYDTQETVDPYTKEKKFSRPVFNQDRADQFTLFANANNLDPDDTAFRLWRKTLNQNNPQQPKQNKNSGDIVAWLKARNISDETSAAEAIKELRAKKWTDEQINSAFDELGL